ncbi:MAG: hypothetical protein LC797_19715 [Chloroflexi bacterium]|nr:hypothetical protein [Chloroflexota bacterium]
MPVTDLSWPSRLLAGGGPSAPDPRVLRALGAPLIGQFDPDFTAIMDDVMALARPMFSTSNPRCFPVSGLAPAGLEALLNTLVQDGDQVAIGGGPRFVADTADVARRLGAVVCPIDQLERAPGPRLLVAPMVDPVSGCVLPIPNLATAAHRSGARLVVDATLGTTTRRRRVSSMPCAKPCDSSMPRDSRTSGGGMSMSGSCSALDWKRLA